MDECSKTSETAFASSQERFAAVVAALSTSDMSRKPRAEVEAHLSVVVRELMQCMYQDHLDLRTVGEHQHEDVVDGEGASPHPR